MDLDRLTLDRVFDALVLGEVSGLAAKAAAMDVAPATGDELLDAARSLIEARTALDAATAHVLAELDVRGTTDRERGLSTGTWFAREAGVPVGAGRDRVRVARTLHDRLDRVDAALVEGRVSWDHARVLATACHPRIADRVTAVQDQLLDLADGTVFDVWRRHVAGIVSMLDDDGGHDPDADLARNHLSVVPTVDGVTYLSGSLVGEPAEVARHAIDTVADELFRQFAADHARAPDIKVPSRDTLRALAFVELCRRGLAIDLRSTAAPRPDVTLVVRAEDPDRAVSTDGVPLADGTTRVLLCDPDLTAVIVDRLGVPLDAGHRTRLATPAQRRALAVRDGGCLFPGCDAPVSWTDAHHVRHHRHGGPTALGNLASVCRFHHGVTHRAGWTMRPAGDGRFTWTTPSGLVLHSQRQGVTAPAEPP
jgi:hypothetical protein